MQVDAIVNTTNTEMVGEGGVDLAVHTAAGRGLDEECARLAPLGVGQARLTGGYNLQAKYIIHTVSPVWRGGAVAFGPKPRSYAVSVNKKVEKLALKRAFTDRVNDGDVIAVDSLELENNKTKTMLAVLKALNAGDSVLVLVDEYQDNLDLAARNLPNVLVIKGSAVNTYLMMLFKKVIVTPAAVQQLAARLV